MDMTALLLAFVAWSIRNQTDAKSSLFNLIARQASASADEYKRVMAILAE